MNDDPRMRYRLSSGRRHLPEPDRSSRIIVWTVLLLITAAIVFFELQRRANLEPEASQPPRLAPSPPVVLTPSPTPSPSPSPTATPFWEMESDPLLVPSPTATPMPTSTPTPRPTPTQTLGVLDCIEWTWNASTSQAAWGQILITIDLRNRCGRPLEVGELFFNIAGYRQGGYVQGVRGNLVRPLGRSERRDVIIALPGSLDWYDEIVVEAFAGRPTGL